MGTLKQDQHSVSIGFRSNMTTLPYSKTYRNRWVKVSTGHRGTCNNGEGDTQRKCKADLKKIAEEGDGQGSIGIESKGRDCCDSREHIEEHPGGFCDALS